MISVPTSSRFCLLLLEMETCPYCAVQVKAGDLYIHVKNSLKCDNILKNGKPESVMLKADTMEKVRAAMAQRKRRREVTAKYKKSQRDSQND